MASFVFGFIDEIVYSDGQEKAPPGASQLVYISVYGIVMSPANPQFPDRLKRARELRQMSQGDLAKKAKLQPSAVSHFETGSRKPSFENLSKLADALEVSTDYLLGRVDSPDAVHDGSESLFKDFSQMNPDDRDFARDFVKKLAKRGQK